MRAGFHFYMRLVGFPVAALLIVAAAGCVTRAALNPKPPTHCVFSVKAAQPWQDSGVYVWQGDVVQCVATGKWSDHNGTYGPEGNPEILKDHLGTKAPANALLMRISSQTNQAYYIGRETNLIAETRGNLLFRSNVSLPVDVSGQIAVEITVGPDADGDGVSDYDEVYVWKLDPLNPDTDGDGFTDREEIFDKLNRAKKNKPLH